MKKIELTPRGRELFEQQIERLKREPEKFDMKNWFAVHGTTIVRASKEQIDFSMKNECGTTLCIAGGIFSSLRSDEIHPREKYYIEYTVQEILGISEEQSDQIFLSSACPREFRDEYNVASSYEQRAQVGIKRIQHLLEKGE